MKKNDNRYQLTLAIGLNQPKKLKVTNEYINQPCHAKTTESTAAAMTAESNNNS